MKLFKSTLQRIFLLDNREPFIVPLDPVVVRHTLNSGEGVQKLFIVRDDQQLKVLLLLSRIDNFGKRVAQTVYIFPVEISGGLVQRQNTTIRAERLRQRHPYDEAS
jgi:hypothetical protein